MKRILFILVVAILCCGALDAKPARKTAKKATTTKLTKNNRSTEFTPTGSHGGHDYVDLGLQSGTLWATTNIGANSPEEFGDYFAWGETSPKSSYDRSNYKWYKYDVSGLVSCITKYNIRRNLGTVDNKNELDLMDDAAYVNWGSGWRMPSWDQIAELVVECDWTLTTRNGVKGFEVSRNGRALFLPAAVFSDPLNDKPYAHYWSRALDDRSYKAHSMNGYEHSHAVGDEAILISGGCDRDIGLSVRAVRSSE